MDKKLMTTGEAVAKRVNEYLFIRNISLYKLSKDSGIPLSTLKNLYNLHTKSPTLALVFRITAGLRISFSEFMDSELFRLENLELE